jgi:hypothetical protein
MKARGLLFLILLAASSAAEAADFTKVDLRPWIRVRASYFFHGAPQLQEIEGLQDRDAYVTKGGALFTSSSARNHPVAAPEPFSTEILRGVGTAAERQALATALIKAEIGFQTDCQLAPSPGASNRVEIIWYGKGIRRNRFVVFVHNVEDPAVPRCSSGVFDLLVALGTFESAVARHPDSEVLRSP